MTELMSRETESTQFKAGNISGEGSRSSSSDLRESDNSKSSSSKKKNNIDMDSSPFRAETSSSTSKLSSSSSSSQLEKLLMGTAEEEEEEEGEEYSRRDGCLSYGIISVIGRRRVMEDAVAVAIGEGGLFDFFGVYDGHGGSRVASACRERMHKLVAEEVRAVGSGSGSGGGDDGGGGSGGGGVVDWEKVMGVCFEKMDQEVSRCGNGSHDESLINTVGSTAVVVVLRKDELVVANCGDSRAVLCRAGVPVPLSSDHKPDRPDEMERVEAAGGRVINWNSSRILGVLATSRSIGDHYLKPFVISEPEVTVSPRTSSDNFLILASDGLWDVISNEVACEVVKRYLDGRIRRKSAKQLGSSSNPTAEAANILAELALAKGSRDNITVIVIELNKSTGCS
ncbi:hypothetical protein ACFE04_011796 [Oxalis oulophora]